jgi:hypothetical protein
MTFRRQGEILGARPKSAFWSGSRGGAVDETGQPPLINDSERGNFGPIAVHIGQILAI